MSDEKLGVVIIFAAVVSGLTGFLAGYLIGHFEKKK